MKSRVDFVNESEKHFDFVKGVNKKLNNVLIRSGLFIIMSIRSLYITCSKLVCHFFEMYTISCRKIDQLEAENINLKSRIKQLESYINQES